MIQLSQCRHCSYKSFNYIIMEKLSKKVSMPPLQLQVFSLNNQHISNLELLRKAPHYPYNNLYTRRTLYFRKDTHYF